jgi:hypothetical protein
LSLQVPHGHPSQATAMAVQTCPSLLAEAAM